MNTFKAAPFWRRKPFSAGILFCISFVSAMAAQPVRGQSDFTREAPLIENERVKVWDITLAQGQSAVAQSHQNDFVTMFLVGATFRSIDDKGQSRVVERKFGEATFGRTGAAQRDEVVSKGPARLIVIELKAHPQPPYANTSGFPAAFPRPGSTKVLENEHVVVWNYSWTPQSPTPMHFHDKDVVVVYRYNGSLKSTLPDGTSTVNDYKAGMVRFNKGNRIHFEELVSGQQSAMMMELR